MRKGHADSPNTVVRPQVVDQVRLDDIRDVTRRAVNARVILAYVR